MRITSVPLRSLRADADRRRSVCITTEIEERGEKDDGSNVPDSCSSDCLLTSHFSTSFAFSRSSIKLFPRGNTYTYFSLLKQDASASQRRGRKWARRAAGAASRGRPFLVLRARC